MYSICELVTYSPDICPAARFFFRTSWTKAAFLCVESHNSLVGTLVSLHGKGEQTCSNSVLCFAQKLWFSDHVSSCTFWSSSSLKPSWRRHWLKYSMTTTCYYCHIDSEAPPALWKGFFFQAWLLLCHSLSLSPLPTVSYSFTGWWSQSEWSHIRDWVRRPHHITLLCRLLSWRVSVMTGTAAASRVGTSEGLLWERRYLLPQLLPLEGEGTGHYQSSVIHCILLYLSQPVPHCCTYTDLIMTPRTSRLRNWKYRESAVQDERERSVGYPTARLDTEQTGKGSLLQVSGIRAYSCG